MTEIYKDIKDLEELYQVSNFGNILSLNYRNTGRAELLKPEETPNGYLRVELWKNKEKKRCLVHRLVAETFLPNPDNLPEVNHKDENKTNNSVDNLEWCNHKYNINHGTHNERSAKTRSKPVLQLTKSGDLIREYPSIIECGKNGFHQGNVCSCCNGKRKSAHGFLWKYKE